MLSGAITSMKGNRVEDRRSVGSDARRLGNFWVWATCLILGLLVLGGVALTLGWQEYRENHRGAERVRVYSLAVTVTARLTDERASLIELLDGGPLPAGLTGPGLVRQRAHSDEAIAQLGDALPRQRRAEVRAFRDARDALAAIRRDVDGILAQPQTRRDPDALDGAVARLSAVLERVASATEAVHGAQVADLAMAMDDVATADLAARVHEHGDRLRVEGQTAGAVARGHAQIAEYLRGIDARVDPGIDDPRVNAAWERLEGAASRAGLDSAPTASGAPPAGADDLTDVIAAAEPLRDVALQVGEERAEERRDAALRWLVALVGFVGAGLVAAGVAIVVVRRRVVAPLLLARSQIIALADGDLPEAVGPPGGNRAVVALFDAMEVLRRSQERRFALERERAALSEQLEVQARTDALTGLLNRHALETAARDLVADGAGEPGVGLIMCDLDRFKAINDRHGHLAGDAVLREVAARLRRRCDAGELVARFGGEEFVVLVRGGRLDGVAALAEELRSSVAGSPVSVGNGDALDVTASFGVVAGRRDDGWEALVASADAALYEAKQTGRNRVVARRHAGEGEATPSGSPRGATTE